MAPKKHAVKQEENQKPPAKPTSAKKAKQSVKSPPPGSIKSSPAASSPAPSLATTISFSPSSASASTLAHANARASSATPGMVTSGIASFNSVGSAVAALSRVPQISGATIQSITNQGKMNLPKDGLAAFGIKPAANAGSDKDSKLVCVIISTENGGAVIVFRCAPNNPNLRFGSMSEKYWFDAVRTGEPWVKQANIDDDMRPWVHNEVEQKNPRGYNIRLFTLSCAEFPTEESVVQLGRYICEQVNAMPNNNTTMVVDPANYFWIPTADGPVWSDVIGSDAALKELVAKKGMPSRGYYETNREAIHCYFRPHTFTMDLARVLYAPEEQLHPEARAYLNQQVPNQADEAMMVPNQADEAMMDHEEENVPDLSDLDDDL